MIERSVGMSGEYQFTVLNADGSVKVKTDWMKNLITNNGLDCVGQNRDFLRTCMVGTGTVAPTNADTWLQAIVAFTTSSVSKSTINVGAPSYASQFVKTFQFTQGSVVGNITEVGIGYNQLLGGTFSRALIVDGSNAPTAITVLASEILQVTYRLSVLPALGDTTGTITISGTVYNYTTRGARIGEVLRVDTSPGGSGGTWLDTAGNFFYGSGALGANAVTPDYTNGQFLASSPVVSEYINGSFYSDITGFASLTNANFAGGVNIVGTYDHPIFNTQTLFAPAFAKDASKTLSVTMRRSWNRV